MTEFWEAKFKEVQTMWGFEPSDSALLVKDFFLKHSIKDILIPGVGYGRNAKVFHENGFNVTGIEISEFAISMARNDCKLSFPIHHGSVTEMPFDSKQYDGIFCYALLHLLNKHERHKFIECCYNQLKPGGYMIFNVVSKKASMFGEGKLLSKDRYQKMKGLNVFFYDFESVNREFKNLGLVDVQEIDEPIKHMKNEPPLKCILITCKR